MRTWCEVGWLPRAQVVTKGMLTITDKNAESTNSGFETKVSRAMRDALLLNPSWLARQDCVRGSL